MSVSYFGHAVGYRAGRAILTLGTDTTPFVRGLNKAEGHLMRFVSSGTAAARGVSLAFGVPLAAIGSLAVRVSAEYEQTMKHVLAVSNATSRQFKSLEKQTRDLAETTKFTMKQVGEGQVFLAMAGFDVQQILGSMPGIMNLATASGLELARVSDLLTNIMTAFSLETKQTNETMDTLTITFTNTNTSMEQLAEAMKYAAPSVAAFGHTVAETATALGILGNQGIQASLAGTYLRSMMRELGAPSDRIQSKLRELGVQLRDFRGDLMDAGEMVREFERLGVAPSAGTELLGRRGGTGLNALLSAGADAYERQLALTRLYVDETKKIASEMLDSLIGDLHIAFAKIQSFLTRIADSGFGKMVRNFVQWGQKFIDSLNGISEATLRWAAALSVIPVLIAPALLLMASMVMKLGITVAAWKAASKTIAKLGGIEAALGTARDRAGSSVGGMNLGPMNAAAGNLTAAAAALKAAAAALKAAAMSMRGGRGGGTRGGYGAAAGAAAGGAAMNWDELRNLYRATYRGLPSGGMGQLGTGTAGLLGAGAASTSSLWGAKAMRGIRAATTAVKRFGGAFGPVGLAITATAELMDRMVRGIETSMAKAAAETRSLAEAHAEVQRLMAEGPKLRWWEWLFDQNPIEAFDSFRQSFLRGTNSVIGFLMRSPEQHHQEQVDANVARRAVAFGERTDQLMADIERARTFMSEERARAAVGEIDPSRMLAGFRTLTEHEIPRMREEFGGLLDVLNQMKDADLPPEMLANFREIETIFSNTAWERGIDQFVVEVTPYAGILNDLSGGVNSLRTNMRDLSDDEFSTRVDAWGTSLERFEGQIANTEYQDIFLHWIQAIRENLAGIVEEQANLPHIVESLAEAVDPAHVTAMNNALDSLRSEWESTMDALAEGELVWFDEEATAGVLDNIEAMAEALGSDEVAAAVRQLRVDMGAMAESAQIMSESAVFGGDLPMVRMAGGLSPVEPGMTQTPEAFERAKEAAQGAFEKMQQDAIQWAQRVGRDYARTIIQSMKEGDWDDAWDGLSRALEAGTARSISNYLAETIATGITNKLGGGFFSKLLGSVGGGIAGSIGGAIGGFLVGKAFDWIGGADRRKRQEEAAAKRQQEFAAAAAEYADKIEELRRELVELSLAFNHSEAWIAKWTAFIQNHVDVEQYAEEVDELRGAIYRYAKLTEQLDAAKEWSAGIQGLLPESDRNKFLRTGEASVEVLHELAQVLTHSGIAFDDALIQVEKFADALKELRDFEGLVEQFRETGEVLGDLEEIVESLTGVSLLEMTARLEAIQNLIVFGHEFQSGLSQWTSDSPIEKFFATGEMSGSVVSNLREMGVAMKDITEFSEKRKALSHFDDLVEALDRANEGTAEWDSAWRAVADVIEQTTGQSIESVEQLGDTIQQTSELLRELREGLEDFIPGGSAGSGSALASFFETGQLGGGLLSSLTGAGVPGDLLQNFATARSGLLAFQSGSASLRGGDIGSPEWLKEMDKLRQVLVDAGVNHEALKSQMWHLEFAYEEIEQQMTDAQRAAADKLYQALGVLDESVSEADNALRLAIEETREILAEGIRSSADRMNYAITRALENLADEMETIRKIIEDALEKATGVFADAVGDLVKVIDEDLTASQWALSISVTNAADAIQQAVNQLKLLLDGGGEKKKTPDPPTPEPPPNVDPRGPNWWGDPNFGKVITDSYTDLGDQGGGGGPKTIVLTFNTQEISVDKITQAIEENAADIQRIIGESSRF